MTHPDEVEGKFSPAFAALVSEAEAIARQSEIRLLPIGGIGRPGAIIDRSAVRDWWVLGNLPADLSVLHKSDLLSASNMAFSAERAWSFARLPFDGIAAVISLIFAERAVRGIDSGGVTQVAA